MRHDGGIVSCAFAGNRYLLTGGRERDIKLFNLEHERFVCDFVGGHNHEISEIAIKNDDQTQFASCGGDKNAMIWDVSSKRIERKLYGHTQRINSICWDSPFSSVICTGSNDGTVIIHDARQSNPVQKLQCSDNVSAVRCQDDAILVGCMNGEIRLYSIRAGEMTTLRAERPVSFIDIFRGGSFLASYTKPGCVGLFNGNGELLQQYHGHVNDLLRLPCQLCEDCVIGMSENDTLYVWDIESSRVLKTTSFHRLATFVYSATAEQMILCSSDGDISIQSAWKPSI